MIEVSIAGTTRGESHVRFQARDTRARFSGLAARSRRRSALPARHRPRPQAGSETIIVTATRRAENLQDVSGVDQRLRQRRHRDARLKQMDDYAKFVPGLSLGVREPGGTTIVFRGVASSGLQFGAVSSSALYLDEQPITQSGNNPDPRLVDIERLEALRGPQGTLYGASSQSGTLRVITNKPDPSEFDGWVDLQGTSVDEGGEGYDASVMLNVPLVADRLALRVGFRAEEAGFIDNVLSDPAGQLSPGEGTFTNADRVAEDVNEAQTKGARAAALGRQRRGRRDARRAVPGAGGRRTRRRQPRRGRSEPGPVRGREPRGQVVPACVDPQCLAAVWGPGRLGLLLRP